MKLPLIVIAFTSLLSACAMHDSGKVYTTRRALVEEMRIKGYALFGKPRLDSNGGMSLLFLPAKLTSEFPQTSSDEWYYIESSGEARHLHGLGR